MDINMILAFIFVIILVSIVMTTLGGVIKRHIRYKEREMELRNAPPQSGISAAKAEQLEERIRVLERIATDGNADLARQIEDLRLPDSSVEIQRETAR
ncbi:hypothetical protein GCM10009127_29060 [Alteraurantiacibacter aestuarii]|uniref:Uncharacterized protein n=1 Tax=Alteraurantiacibacter aestuarii TaxID=650004 RepID=A0A844ZPN9_9SPHN|nr:hypothetical protein [Alteraurantiacibacter aestuarii]MXO89016.1 hypothetical protein [Alteraurantiacibacter aestuarii]